MLIIPKIEIITPLKKIVEIIRLAQPLTSYPHKRVLKSNDAAIKKDSEDKRIPK